MGSTISPLDPGHPQPTTRRRAPVALSLAALALGLGGALAHAGLGAFGAAVGPPRPTISSAPQRTTVARSATFAVDTTADTSLECALDGAPLVACPGRVTYRALRLGPHVFAVRARSAFGQAGETATYAWRVVERPQPPRELAALALSPRPVLVTTPTRPFVSTSATFSWRLRPGTPTPPGTGYRCALDDGPWLACRSPRTYRGLGTGPHRFALRAQARGLRPSRANRFTWTIEVPRLQAPRLTRQPAATTDAHVVAFAFEGAGAGFECALDGGRWQRCTSPVALVAIASGPHTFCVRSVTGTGAPGPPACASWQQVAPTQSSGSAPPPAPQAFTLSATLPTVLSPGLGASLPLTISNPNAFPIRVSGLVVSVATGSSHPGCDGPTNLAVTPSNAAGGAVSVVVPAGGSVTLPAQGATAPVVTMLDLPTSQDACKEASFTLELSGMGSQA